MKNRTVELLSVASNADDLWQELHKECSPHQLSLYIHPSNNYRIRLLGPFMSIYRMYLPTKMKAEFIRNGKLADLLNKNHKVIEELRAKIRNNDLTEEDDLEDDSFGGTFGDPYAPELQRNGRRARRVLPGNTGTGVAQDPFSNLLGSESTYSGTNYGGASNTFQVFSTEQNSFSQQDISQQTLSFLQRVEDDAWSECAMSNCFVDNEIKLLALTRTMCDSLFASVNDRASEFNRKPEDIKISGLHAYSIAMQKQGRGLGSTYNISLSDKQSFLSDRNTSHIFKVGLLDIPSTLELLTNSPKHPFIYRAPSNYRMAKNLYSELYEESRQKEEQIQIDYMEERINDLPQDAFENISTTNNPINSLEL